MDKMILSKLEEYHEKWLESPLFIDDCNTDAFYMTLLKDVDLILNCAYGHAETNCFETLLAWVKIRVSDSLMWYDSALVNYYMERKLKNG